jgi:hypothetical protein
VILHFLVVIIHVHKNSSASFVCLENPTGRLVLVKYVLSSLPIYQFSALLAPVGIKKYLAEEIRKLLWKGGKYNSKIFHLANWSLVRSPKPHGGMGIRDPKLVNISLMKTIMDTSDGGK